jgi:hypothetical protein
MTATVVACFVTAGTLEGRSATLALIAGGCFAVMLAITLVGNMPLNLRVFRWDEEHETRGVATDSTPLGPAPHGPGSPR